MNDTPADAALDQAPVAEAERLEALDLLRGFAVLGISSETCSCLRCRMRPH